MTALFAIQAIAGAVLSVAWWRQGRRGAGTLLAHIGPNLTSFALWIAYTVIGNAWWAWAAFFVLTVGTGFGDKMLVTRFRRMQGVERAGAVDYGAAIHGVFTGRLPGLVTFHALFSAAVYFGCLGVTIGATVADLSS